MILPANPPKQAEIGHYAVFVDALPRGSYLAALLGDTKDAITAQIRQDLAFPDTLHAMWEQKAQADRDRMAARRVATEARAELTRLENKIRWATEELAELKRLESRIKRDAMAQLDGLASAIRNA